MHEEWTDQLSDYLDGELPDDERHRVDAHLRTCAECTAVLNDLKRIVARAQGISSTSRPPQADLWPGIANGIESSHASVRPFTPRPRGRVSLTVPQLAAAAALIATVSGGMVWMMRSAPAPAIAEVAAPASSAKTPTDEPERFASADRVVPVSMAEAQYDAAVADLERALKQGRGRLDASTIAIVEHNLQIIDEAIDQAREALVADPVNTYLSGHLVEARRRKLDLLRRATALTRESD